VNRYRNRQTFTSLAVCKLKRDRPDHSAGIDGGSRGAIALRQGTAEHYKKYISWLWILDMLTSNGPNLLVD
jgi:hypothetical protein